MIIPCEVIAVNRLHSQLEGLAAASPKNLGTRRRASLQIIASPARAYFTLARAFFSAVALASASL